MTGKEVQNDNGRPGPRLTTISSSKGRTGNRKPEPETMYGEERSDAVYRSEALPFEPPECRWGDAGD